MTCRFVITDEPRMWKTDVPWASRFGGGVAIAAVALALVWLPAGCGLDAGSSHRDAPVLLAQAKGICPSQPVSSKMPSACTYSRGWNGATPVFRTPRRMWGVAYAFNCGGRPGDFSFAARMIAMDHTALPGDRRHAKRGTGYTTFSRSTMVTLVDNVPQGLKLLGHIMEVDVASTCTWQVKAILGSRRDVASAVPPVPAMQSRWWK